MAKSPNGVLSASGVEAEPVRSSSGPPQSYTDLDKLRSADGIIAVISQRRSTGVITFGIFKEFERDGTVERTSFVPENLAGSYLAMVQLVIERIAQLKIDSGNRALRR